MLHGAHYLYTHTYTIFPARFFYLSRKMIAKHQIINADSNNKIQTIRKVLEEPPVNTVIQTNPYKAFPIQPTLLRPKLHTLPPYSCSELSFREILKMQGPEY